MKDRLFKEYGAQQRVDHIALQEEGFIEHVIKHIGSMIGEKIAEENAKSIEIVGLPHEDAKVLCLRSYVFDGTYEELVAVEKLVRDHKKEYERNLESIKEYRRREDYDNNG